jgi:hypothetical protein
MDRWAFDLLMTVRRYYWLADALTDVDRNLIIGALCEPEASIAASA